MADSDSTADQWLEAQRRYWDAWTDMARRGIEATTPAPRAPANPWADALDQWWKAVAPSLPQSNQGPFDQMMNLGKSYFSMAEQFSGGGAGVPTNPTEIVEKWSRMMTDAFGQANQGLNPFAAMAGQGARPGKAFWDLPLDNWARTFSGGLPIPGDFLKAFDIPAFTGEGPEDMRARMDRFLATPAVGYARESQEQQQNFVRRLLEYEKAMGEYQAGFAELMAPSLEAFRRRLEATAKEHGPINSIRQIYDTWVDAFEEVYAEYANSDAYARRYGGLVNALMGVKREGARLVDEQLEAMNMPTRSEIGVLEHRLHDTRAAYRKLRFEAEGLREDLDAQADIQRETGDALEHLRAELDQLRAQVGSAKPESSGGSGKTGGGDAAQSKDEGEATGSTEASKSAAKPKPTRTRTASPSKGGTSGRKTQS